MTKSIIKSNNFKVTCHYMNISATHSYTHKKSKESKVNDVVKFYEFCVCNFFILNHNLLLLLLFCPFFNEIVTHQSRSDNPSISDYHQGDELKCTMMIVFVDVVIHIKNVYNHIIGSLISIMT